MTVAEVHFVKGNPYSGVILARSVVTNNNLYAWGWRNGDAFAYKPFFVQNIFKSIPPYNAILVLLLPGKLFINKLYASLASSHHGEI